MLTCLTSIGGEGEVLIIGYSVSDISYISVSGVDNCIVLGVGLFLRMAVDLLSLEMEALQL